MSSCEGLLEVALAVLGADHKADLTGWVGGDGCVGVLDVGEDSLARLLEVGNDVEVQPLVLGLSRDDTTLAESAVQELEVRLLEKSLGGALWVAGVGDDDIKLVLLVLEEFEAVADNGLGLGVVEANGHAGEVLLRQADDSLVDVAKDGLLDALVLDDLTKDTAVTTTDNKDVLGVGVGVHGKVGNHLLVGELVTLSALNDVVKDKNHAVVGRLEDENVLVQALLVVKNLLDLEGHSLTRPHARDLTEPAICAIESAFGSTQRTQQRTSCERPYP